MCKLEVIATCVADVAAAREGGADRVELISSLTEGGLTPSYGYIERAVNAAGHMKVMTMIRPHAMSFVYSSDDIDIMIRDIDIARKLGSHGVVFGVITSDGRIDIETTNKLIESSRDLDITFHRAFDDVEDKLSAYEELCELNINNLLTSHWLELHGFQDRVQVLAGGGMTIEKIARAKSIGADVHFGAAMRRGGKPLEPVLEELVRWARNEINRL